MNKSQLQPLTDAEKRDAEKYHNMIYSFLWRQKYSIEEFYDIAVMGFLKGIQSYHRNKHLQNKWSISTICNNCMKREIGNYFKAESTKKRMPEGGFTSLDATFEDYNESFINSIITPTLEDEFFEEYDKQEESESIREILAPLTAIQRKIVILKASGKNLDFISKKLHISKIAINRELKKLRGEGTKEKTATAEPAQSRKTVENVTDYIGVPTEIILTLKLSARQLDVVNLLMVGYKESDVGRELGLSRQAVYDAVRKIRKKADKLK